MKVEINVVPPGGGETDYTMIVDLPAVPATGDYLLLRERPSQEDNFGVRSHIVRRTWWYLESTDESGNKKLADIALEVEIAESSADSREHKEHLVLYRTKDIKTLDDSTY